MDDAKARAVRRCRQFCGGAVVQVALALLLNTPAADAQEGWGSAPDVISDVSAPGGNWVAPKVGVDAAGNAIAAWTEATGASGSYVVRAARFAAATRQWSAPVTLSTGTRLEVVEDLAVDGSGNAIVVFRSNPISTIHTLGVRRFDAATLAWTSVPMTADMLVSTARVGTNQAGDAAVCWQSQGSTCRRYSSTTAGWSAAEPLGVWGEVADVRVDASGNVQVLLRVGVVTGGLQVVRYDAVSAGWSAPVDLTTAHSGFGATLALNEAGDAVALWSRNGAIEAARYSASGTQWTSPVVIGSGGTKNDFSRAVVAPAGDITVAWIQEAGMGLTIKVARFDALASAWSAPADLPGQVGLAYPYPALGVDARGNVHVVWGQAEVSEIRLFAARYRTATGTWTTARNLSSIGQTINNPSVAVDPGGSAMAVWFQSAGSLWRPEAIRWTATLLAPSLTGLTPATGASTIDVTVPAAADPELAATNLEYSLDDGATWTTRTPASPTAPIAVSGLTDGTPYSLRLRTVNGGGSGRASTPIRFRSGNAPAPGSLRVISRSGNSLTLAWTTPAAGLEPTSFQVEGGLAGQSAILGVVPTGGTATQTTIAVPTGDFFVQVAAMWNGTRLGVSAPLVIAVNTSASPSAPVGLLGSTSGATLALSWRNTWEGAVPDGIRLAASGAITASVVLPLSESFTFAGVPDGTYSFTVQALHGGVASPPSAAVTLTFPGTCAGVPLPPTAFSATTQGGRIYLDWLPPATGDAVASYVVSVAGAFTGSFNIATRTLAAPAPPGSYTVQVASVGLCGTSPLTPPQTVVVP